MKTIYLLKTLVPFIFLPIAPGVIQVGLEHQGLLHAGTGEFLVIAMQILFSLGLIGWLGVILHRKNKAQAFLTMSSVSKKVFHKNRWMTVEQYLAEHHNIVVSHALTPEESEDWVRESEEWIRIHAQTTTESVTMSIAE
jgi:hypothetical protein